MSPVARSPKLKMSSGTFACEVEFGLSGHGLERRAVMMLCFGRAALRGAALRADNTSAHVGSYVWPIPGAHAAL
jgi:hypothetical protein